MSEPIRCKDFQQNWLSVTNKKKKIKTSLEGEVKQTTIEIESWRFWDINVCFQLLHDFAWRQVTNRSQKRSPLFYVVLRRLRIQISPGIKMGNPFQEATLVLQRLAICGSCTPTSRIRAGTPVTQRTGRALNWHALMLRWCDRWTPVSDIRWNSHSLTFQMWGIESNPDISRISLKFNWSHHLKTWSFLDIIMPILRTALRKSPHWLSWIHSKITHEQQW